MKKKKQKKVVVFGGAGFLGTQVMNLLIKKGYKAISLSRRSGCDMRSFGVIFDRLKREKPDVIINCSAHVGSVHYAMEYAGDLIHDNILIITNLYRAVTEACPKAKIINPVSNCSYPGEANIHSEPDWEKGAVHESVLSYGSTRRLIYALADSYHRQYKLKSINWLVSNAYGPGDYLDPYKVHALNGITIRLIKAQRKKRKSFEIWGSGNPTREWVFIKDVARVLVESVNYRNQIYPTNIGQNKAYSINEITKIIADILRYKVKFTHNNLPDGAPTKILDDKKFRQSQPDFKFTSLKNGIKQTIDYYKKNLSK